MTEFLSWGILGTYSGAVIFTALVVQLIKKEINIPTQLVSYLVALLILEGSLVFTGSWNMSDGALCLVNAVIVSLASNGGYAGIERIISAVKKEEDE